MTLSRTVAANSTNGLSWNQYRVLPLDAPAGQGVGAARSAEGARTRPLDASEAGQPPLGSQGALLSLTPDATRASVGSPEG